MSTQGSRDERFEIAESLEERGEYLQALSRWRELALETGDAAIFCRQARLAKRVGNLLEAESAFRKAIQIDDTLSWAYVGLGSILINRSEYSEAVNLLRKALAYEKSEIAYTMMGVALSSIGRSDEAAANFDAALALDSNYEEAYFNLGLVRKETDRTEAERLFVKALEIAPDYADAHREVGWLLGEADPSPRAEYHLRRAAELDPADMWARIYLGNLLWRRGDIEAAVSEFEKAISLRPNRSLPLWSLANVYESQEKWEKAQELYERAVKVEPDDAVAHMNFGRMLLKRCEVARAASHLRRALSIDPEYHAAQTLLTDSQTKPSGR